MRDSGLERRWAAALAHRERLLRIARARTSSSEDAEDVVQEAMLRCVEFDELDEERLGRFLTSVTVRLCVDEHRKRTQSQRLGQRLAAEPTTGPGCDEAVCDQGEAVWVAELVDSLPPRQREVLVAKAEGLSCGEIGGRFRMSYKAVESALTHARRALRASLAATLGLGLLVKVGWKSRTVAVAAVPVVASAVIVGGLARIPSTRPDDSPAGPRTVQLDPVRPVKPVRAVPAAPAGPAAASHRSRPAPPASAGRRAPGQQPVAYVGDKDNGAAVTKPPSEPVGYAQSCVRHGASVRIADGKYLLHQSCGVSSGGKS